MKNLSKIFAFMSLILMGYSGISQQYESSIEEDAGDKHLETFAFDKAIESYQSAYENDSENSRISRKIADAYRRSGDLPSSTEWYGRTLELDSTRKEDMLYYAEALKTVEQYDESLIWYGKYNSLQPEDDRATSHLVSSEYVEELTEDSVMFIVKKLDFNNRKPAFGVTKYQEKLVFSATGLEGQKNNKTNPWNDMPYLDVYQANIDDNNEAVDIEPINEINSKYNDGPAHFDEVSQTMLITRNNMKRGKPVKDKTGAVNLKIYTSKNVDGKWSEIEELPFNSDDYSTGHPTVTKDGQYLYFASNRPGGLGGTDIYVSEKINDTWGHPENLGDMVNTKGDELFPYVDDTGVLYFSSTGHLGLGGMDIFKINLDSLKKHTPENLGYPLNSAKDDFSLVFEKTNESGYFCSNREKGFSDDIFYFEINNTIQKVYAGRIVSSISEKSLAGTELIVRNLTSGEEISLILDENGGFEFDAEAGVTYELAYQKEDVEEILAVKTVEDVVDLEYENLGIFTIHERLAVNVYDDTDELDIDGNIYKRFGEDGKFLSEQGDTLSNIQMMDLLTSKLDGNSIEFNGNFYSLDEKTQNYVNEDGDVIEEDELEQLLISEIIANPLELTDDSSLAGITPKDSELELANLWSAEAKSLNLSEISALEWVEEALKDDNLSPAERLELEALQNSDLPHIKASEWLAAMAENPDLTESLSEVEKKALGITPADEELELPTANIPDEETTVENELNNATETASTLLSAPFLDPSLDYSAIKGFEAPLSTVEVKGFEITSEEELKSVLKETNLENIYFDYDKAYVRKDAALSLDKLAKYLIANPELEMYVNAHTDSRGNNAYNELLSAKRAKMVNSYLIARGVSEERLNLEWFGEDKLANACDSETECSENDHQLNRRATFALAGNVSKKSNLAEDNAPSESSKPSDKLSYEDANLGQIEMIYYDFDKSTIRTDASKILDELSAQMSKNNASIIIHAHTDLRGSDAYNNYLSEQRALKAKAYLTSKGIDASRVEIAWSGEDNLANKCNSGCNAQEHQLNRRASITWK